MPDVRFVFAGPQDAVGETTWRDLQPLIEKYREHLTFLGTLPAETMPDFLAACDVVTVPSINNTESFGMVQVEAFMCGTPTVATDLPGVRQPVAMSGMGEIVPVADVEGLAQGIVGVLGAGEVRPAHDEIVRIFGIDRTVDAYEELFARKKVGSIQFPEEVAPSPSRSSLTLEFDFWPTLLWNRCTGRSSARWSTGSLHEDVRASGAGHRLRRRAFRCADVSRWD